MAQNSTSRRRIGAALGALGVSIIASAALVGMAGTAAAHTPKLVADCAEDGSWVKVELTQYNDRQANTVTVTVDDEVVVDEEFGKSFKKELTDLDPTTTHTVNVAVAAWDDPQNKKGWSFSKDLTIDACVEPAPPSSSEPPASEEPSTPPVTSTPEETEEAPSSTTAPAPPTTSVEVEEAALADTGASIAIPLGIGAVLLAGGVALMVIVRRRGRA